MDPWRHGACYLGNNTTKFRTWAPEAEFVKILIQGAETQEILCHHDAGGYHEVIAPVGPGARYLIQVDNNEPRPDPASRSQPDGVHAPSAVVDNTFSWTDDCWKGLSLKDYIIYEVHPGTFSTDGTFHGITQELTRLKELGINAIELMPLAQYPGNRNWGYDGVYPFAVQHSYGGLTGLKDFINQAHAHGIAVIIDVVYNHLGPEGNYLSTFGPYFTDNYKTPWGQSLNFDGPWSDQVKEYFIANALFWLDDCHADALRLDAVHAIIDVGADPFLRSLSHHVAQNQARLGRRLHLIAENDRNDPSYARPISQGGLGMDSQWSDDFHHALHAVLTGETHGYYSDFGRLSHLAKAIESGYVYDGNYSPHRKRHHGANSRDLSGECFVICTQNHDQVGNRPAGERLSSLVTFPHLKLAAATLIAAPNIPLIFMGEEHAERNPFLYFTSHTDPALVEGVRKGRQEEFKEFFAKGEAPDPQGEDTYQRSVLTPQSDLDEEQRRILAVYKSLLALRRTLPALKNLDKRNTRAHADDVNLTMWILREHEETPVAVAFNFSNQTRQFTIPGSTAISVAPDVAVKWHLVWHSEEPRFGGNGEVAITSLDDDIQVTVSLPPFSAAFMEKKSCC